MKKSFAFLCLFLAVFQIATAQVKAVSVDVTGKKLEKVLDEITTQSGVVFSYDRKIADTPISAKGLFLRCLINCLPVRASVGEKSLPRESL